MRDQAWLEGASSCRTMQFVVDNFPHPPYEIAVETISLPQVIWVEVPARGDKEEMRAGYFPCASPIFRVVPECARQVLADLGVVEPSNIDSRFVCGCSGHLIE